jgi:hypothetical protein
MTTRRRRLTVPFGIVALLTFALSTTVAVSPLRAQTATLAGVAVNCTTVLAGPETGRDSDGDGITDLQECQGFTTISSVAGASGKTFQRCIVGADGAIVGGRDNCVDPNSKDVFVIYNRAPTGSLLTALPTPFGLVTANNLTFTGFTSLGIVIHQLTAAQAATDRRVNVPLLTAVTPQKAIRVTESLSTNGTILGNCQWGTPRELDGCAIYTARAKSFIDSRCPGDSAAVRNAVFLAYATYLILHETGHAMGGLAPQYNTAAGGYHYIPGTGFIMDQAASYSKNTANQCTWKIPTRWNPTSETAGIILNLP